MNNCQMLQVAKIIFLWDHTPLRQAIIFSLLTLRTVISISKDGCINMEASASSQMEPTVLSCPCDTEVPPAPIVACGMVRRAGGVKKKGTMATICSPMIVLDGAVPGMLNGWLTSNGVSALSTLPP